MKFLTFDLGTTLYKVAVFDESGTLLALERATPPIDRPQPQWAQVDPKSIIEVLTGAAMRLKTRVGFDDVAAVSFATQANSFALMDASGDVITPIILWSDQRAIDVLDELRSVLPRGGPLLALAKLLWLRRHQPGVVARARRLCFISDYFSGVNACEAGVAGLSQALDLRTLDWRRDILERLHVPPIEMPTVHRAGTNLGAFARAEQFGLPHNCPLIVGCLDQYAGAIGTGTVKPGMICETTGTVLAAVRCADRISDNPRPDVFQGPGFDADRFFQMSFSSTSANLLEWYRNQLPDKPGFDELTRLARSAPPSDLIIEPYDDRGSIEASFRNVRPEHSPGQVVSAIMRRVALSLKEQVAHLSGDSQPAEIHSAGGAARNDFWLQMKADTLGVPFVAMECEEPTSLGAAMLAARAMGMGDLPKLSMNWVGIRKRYEPRR